MHIVSLWGFRFPLHPAPGSAGWSGDVDDNTARSDLLRRRLTFNVKQHRLSPLGACRNVVFWWGTSYWLIEIFWSATERNIKYNQYVAKYARRRLRPEGHKRRAHHGAWEEGAKRGGLFVMPVRVNLHCFEQEERRFFQDWGFKTSHAVSAYDPEAHRHLTLRLMQILSLLAQHGQSASAVAG